jgi:hypothetical protein
VTTTSNKNAIPTQRNQTLAFWVVACTSIVWKVRSLVVLVWEEYVWTKLEICKWMMHLFRIPCAIPLPTTMAPMIAIAEILTWRPTWERFPVSSMTTIALTTMFVAPLRLPTRILKGALKKSIIAMIWSHPMRYLYVTVRIQSMGWLTQCMALPRMVAMNLTVAILRQALRETIVWEIMCSKLFLRRPRLQHYRRRSPVLRQSTTVCKL